MENTTVKGTLIVKGDEQQFGDKFRKRSFVIETDDKYPQTIMLELHNENCNSLDAFKEGDALTCLYNLRGRKWVSESGEEKYFNSIVAWSISKGEATIKEKVVDKLGLEDDLPF